MKTLQFPELCRPCSYPMKTWALTVHCPRQVVTYLAGCGLQSCPALLAKGYPDVGWNPIEGERYLSFLRFAVFVNSESQVSSALGGHTGHIRGNRDLFNSFLLVSRTGCTYRWQLAEELTAAGHTRIKGGVSWVGYQELGPHPEGDSLRGLGLEAAMCLLSCQ